MNNHGIFLNGLFIALEKRYREGKADGYNMLISVGTDGHKVKVPDDVADECAVTAFKFGDFVTARVKVSAFRETIYFTASSVGVVSDG